MSEKVLSIANIRDRLPWKYAEMVNKKLIEKRHRTYHESHIRRVMKVADEENRITNSMIWDVACEIVRNHEANFVQSETILEQNKSNSKKSA